MKNKSDLPFNISYEIKPFVLMILALFSIGPFQMGVVGKLSGLLLLAVGTLIFILRILHRRELSSDQE